MEWLAVIAIIALLSGGAIVTTGEKEHAAETTVKACMVCVEVKSESTMKVDDQ